jgi:hypothetical protein
VAFDLQEYCRQEQERSLNDNTGRWVCDGGDVCGTLAAVTRHILDQPSEGPIKCWGAMEYDSVSYQGWLEGQHPMAMIIERTSELYTDYVLKENGIRT